MKYQVIIVSDTHKEGIDFAARYYLRSMHINNKGELSWIKPTIVTGSFSLRGIGGATIYVLPSTNKEMLEIIDAISMSNGIIYVRDYR